MLPFFLLAYCYFLPPAEWEVTNPALLSPKVQISFCGKAKSLLRPSINLVVEKTSASQTDYLKAVKAIHEATPETRWRELGKIQTGAGSAILTEIDTQNETGKIRLLQLILVKEGQAYLLTAAALRDEFPRYFDQFQSVFRSFTITTDLLEQIPQAERRATLLQKQKELLSDETKWEPFESYVLQACRDMGAHWQILYLQDSKNLLTTRKP